MRKFPAIAAIIIATALTMAPAQAQMPDTTGQADMAIDASTRQQVIDQLLRQVSSSYVFPDLAKKVDASIRAQRRRGFYDRIVSAQQLSDVLTTQLQTITGDRHLRIMYSEKPLHAAGAPTAPSAQEVAARLAEMRSENFGIKKVEQLPFNIGYLELTGFAPARDAAATLSAAMTVLAHTDALIIDLRQNLGGDAATVVLLASYLLDHRTRLNDFYYREDNRIEQRWSQDAIPGVRYGQKKDVYVLTSKETFSAAEDFAYTLKHLKRVTVVGETTGGGANPGDDRRLTPHFAVFVPLGRSISPVTQTNWEGTGVKPDVSVCADEALETAQVAILEKMAVSEKGEERLHRMKNRIAQVRSEQSGASNCR